MLDLFKSRLEDALKDASQGLSAYTLLSIFIYTLLFNFNDTHLNQVLHSLLNTKASSFIGESSILLKIKIQDFLYAAITVSILNTLINALRSEYFDLLYLTILKKHIETLKLQNTSTEKNRETELISTYRGIANKQNFLILTETAGAFTAFCDDRITLGLTLSFIAILHTAWALHKSAKFLISKILPAIIHSTPNTTPEQIDQIFSKI
ncbi:MULTISPECIES: hypothetical protein [unclassified Pseudomonas]|uniref:hypothetical protein n=1 Tax=unclassified Pseudomonas TaxID=196821 RepID=UPI000C86D7D9|nr:MULTISPECIES: hypothetical protein [unclassified Pseudomonas]PMV17846.1 hypothetical protein C1X17_28610 [Pseudomonas sp. FW305-3-2-15-C-TSA2]PMV19502.1 hypothetical protein C1X22_28430 [Pseudomonas sp. DP16D-L5]PMV33210.1 hypothetical protein C1X21_29145 [Pseudomonas sp. FW305-3-2-15-A-LB2]PMV38461.1 hypothetical protein C1X16_29070 [Pseudomonas sp. FW305-3-2-15-C-R2A1]PMV43130.1 hypothetical protein C1X18_28805 [Pseudomonas sp. FW305-3-2-15-C-LB1]